MLNFWNRIGLRDTPDTSQERFGLQIVAGSTEAAADVINIIFIHGLGGAARATWMDPDSHSFWPEWLPEIGGLENTRIIVFGYDADWARVWKPNNVLDIADIADQMLNHLSILFSTKGNVTTFFVAHSMGGLIVKEALIKAHNINRFRNVLTNTAGIIFFGTPHRGSSLAGTLDKLLRVSFAERKFVRDLEFGGRTVKHINELFAERSDDMALISFWESRNMAIVGRVVDEISATLGYPREIRVPLNSDHTSIVKFTSKDDSNFILVSNHLVSLVQEASKRCHRNDGGTHVNARNVDRCFLVPYERNPYFSGRTSLLQTLYQRLTEIGPNRYNHRIALYGLGGIGKTQITIEYTYRHRSQYESVFWVSASNRANLLSGFVAIARATQCHGNMADESPDEVARAVLQWLNTSQSWLLVIDNLDDLSVIHGLLPSSEAKGHTLITTRNQNSYGIPAEGLEVTTMEPDEASNFLLVRAKLDAECTLNIRHEVERIVEELGHLPLAIEQAAAYIQASQNIYEFLHVFERNRKEILAWMPDGNSIYNYTVETVWRTSFTRLSLSAPESIVLLKLLVYMNPDEILVDFLTAGSSSVSGELGCILKDKLRLRQCLLDLQKFSLIRVWDEGNKIGIHRLVQSVVKAEFHDDERKLIVKDALCLAIAAFPNAWIEDNLGLCRRFSTQAMSSLENSTGIKDLDREKLLLGLALGKYMDEEGYSIESLRLWKLTAAICEELLGQTHPDTIYSVYRLGNALSNVGQTEQALELLEERLEMIKETLAEDDTYRLTIMSGLAWLYDRMGQLDQALTCYQNLLEVCINSYAFGPSSGTTLGFMQRIAFIHKSLNQFNEAVVILELALSQYISKYGETSGVTLECMRDLATVYDEMADYTRALEVHQKITICTNTLSPEHPERLKAMDALAETYTVIGRYKDAARNYENVLGIRERSLPTHHPLVLQSMKNLASACMNLNEYKKAMMLYETILEIRLKRLGKDHPETLSIMHSAGRAYMEMGRYRDALTMHEKVFENKKRNLGPEHPKTLCSMHELTMAYAKAQDYNAARSLGEQTLSIRRKVLGLNHPDTMGIMHQLARVYSLSGRYHNAVTLYQEVLENNKRILGVYHLKTLCSMHALIRAYIDAQDYITARSLGEQTLSFRRKVLGNDHPHTMGIMHRLARLYRLLGRYDDSIKILRNLKLIQVNLLGSEHLDVINTDSSLAKVYDCLELVEEAASLYRETLAIQSRVLGEDHPKTLRCMRDLAYFYGRTGNYNEAIGLGRQSLFLCSARLGSRHPDTFYGMHLLACLYMAKGHPNEAVTLFETTRDIQIESLGPGNLDVLDTMEGIADALEDLCVSDRSIVLRQQILDKVIENFGPQGTRTLSALLSLAKTYDQAGKSVQAVRLFQQASNTFESIVKQDYPEVWIHMRDLAVAYDNLGLSQKSALLHTKALDKFMGVFHPEHSDVLYSICGLADAYQNLGRFHKALELREKVYHIRTKLWGPMHQDLRNDLVAIANIYDDMGESSRALELYQKALNICNQELDTGHKDTLFCLHGFSWVLLRHGKCQEATGMIQRAIELEGTSMDKEHILSLKLSYILSLIYLQHGQSSEAQEMITRTLEMRKRALSATHPDTLKSLDLVALVHIKAGRADLAIKLLRDNLNSRREVHGTDHPLYAETAHLLAIALIQGGNSLAAVDILGNILKWRREAYGANHPDTLSTERVMLMGLGELKISQEIWREGMFRVFGHQSLVESEISMAEVTEDHHSFDVELKS